MQRKKKRHVWEFTARTYTEAIKFYDARIEYLKYDIDRIKNNAYHYRDLADSKNAELRWYIRIRGLIWERGYKKGHL